jgi:peptide methionine sulfoxide reductase MsrB
MSCTPYIPSRCSWGCFRKRTRLVCRKCGGHIGDAYEDEDSLYDSLDDTQTSSEGSSLSIRKKYVIKINALQPSSDDSGVPSTL